MGVKSKEGQRAGTARTIPSAAPEGKLILVVGATGIFRLASWI